MRVLLAASLLPFLGSILVLCAPARGRRAGVLASVLVAATFVGIASGLPAFLAHPEYAQFPWAPSLGLHFSVLADGLSLLFALVISGVGVIVFSFATAYLDDRENSRRFFAYLSLFMGAMLGVVLSANLISLFVFWELTSVSSFLLIGFWHERDRSRAGALKALVVTSLGGLAMLVGFLMLGAIGGTYEIPELLGAREALAASPLAPWAAALIIAGVITKSAQMPFHNWLPTAMEAPTPVSAFLHAATMVKAGLYLVARLGPLLSVVPLWTPTLTTIGIATMAWASFLALRQSDLKAVLAFSTVSQLGLILAMLAQATPEAGAAGLFHLIKHASFKGALFLLVGIIEHEAHTRDIRELGPLRRLMPRTWLLLALGALSMAGVPPLGGAISKEMFLAIALEFTPALAVIAFAGAVLTAAYCFSLAVGLAVGRRPADYTTEGAPHTPHDPPSALLWGPAALIAVALALGLAPQTLAGILIESAVAATVTASAATGHAAVPHVHLALWHGLTTELAAALLAIGAGFALFWGWWRKRSPDEPTLLSDRAYEGFLERLESWSRAATRAYMSGLVWRYNAIILATGAAGVLAVVWAGGPLAWKPWPGTQATLYHSTVCSVVAGAAVGAAVARTRLAAILALGASGFALALLFSLLGAPDLSLTQIMVETISTALFLAVFVYLPPYRPTAKRPFRPGHFALALLVGCGIPLTVGLARGRRTAESIGTYFVDNSVDLAGGHNIVNVILVDFRGLDTLGEITVLAVAALACYALIKIRPGRVEGAPVPSHGQPEAHRRGEADPLGRSAS